MKIFQFFNNLKGRIREKKQELEKAIKLYSPYFEYIENGKYRFDYTFSKLYNVKYRKQVKKDGVYSFKMKNTLKSHYIDFSTFLASKIISRRNILKVNTDRKKFCGNTIIMSSNLKVVKVFDYKNKLLISISSDTAYMEDVVKNRKEFGRFFNTPKIFSIDIKDNMYCLVEGFVLRKKISFEALFEKFFEAIINYQCKKDCVKTLLKNSDEVLIKLKNETRKFSNFDFRQIEDFVKNGFYKFCLCHVDSHRLNIIYDGNKVYIIDFESIKQCVFFHDIFSYIFSEMFFYGNDILFKKYVEGKFDSLFERLFEVNGLRFEPLNRRIYFYIVIFEKYGGVIPDKTAQFINLKFDEFI